MYNQGPQDLRNMNMGANLGNINMNSPMGTGVGGNPMMSPMPMNMYSRQQPHHMMASPQGGPMPYPYPQDMHDERMMYASPLPHQAAYMQQANMLGGQPVMYMMQPGQMQPGPGGMQYHYSQMSLGNMPQQMYGRGVGVMSYGTTGQVSSPPTMLSPQQQSNQARSVPYHPQQVYTPSTSNSNPGSATKPTNPNNTSTATVPSSTSNANGAGSNQTTSDQVPSTTASTSTPTAAAATHMLSASASRYVPGATASVTGANVLLSPQQQPMPMQHMGGLHAMPLQPPMTAHMLPPGQPQPYRDSRYPAGPTGMPVPSNPAAGYPPQHHPMRPPHHSYSTSSSDAAAVSTPPPVPVPPTRRTFTVKDRDGNIIDLDSLRKSKSSSSSSSVASSVHNVSTTTTTGGTSGSTPVLSSQSTPLTRTPRTGSPVRHASTTTNNTTNANMTAVATGISESDSATQQTTATATVATAGMTTETNNDIDTTITITTTTTTTSTSTSTTVIEESLSQLSLEQSLVENKDETDVVINNNSAGNSNSTNNETSTNIITENHIINTTTNTTTPTITTTTATATSVVNVDIDDDWENIDNSGNISLQQSNNNANNNVNTTTISTTTTASTSATNKSTKKSLKSILEKADAQDATKNMLDAYTTPPPATPTTTATDINESNTTASATSASATTPAAGPRRLIPGGGGGSSLSSTSKDSSDFNASSSAGAGGKKSSQLRLNNGVAMIYTKTELISMRSDELCERPIEMNTYAQALVTEESGSDKKSNASKQQQQGKLIAMQGYYKFQSKSMSAISARVDKDSSSSSDGKFERGATVHGSSGSGKDDGGGSGSKSSSSYTSNRGGGSSSSSGYKLATDSTDDSPATAGDGGSSGWKRGEVTSQPSPVMTPATATAAKYSSSASSSTYAKKSNVVSPRPLKAIVDPLHQLSTEVMQILNKITPQTFEKLTAKICEIPVPTNSLLDKLIELVFEKAIQEPNFANLYADMCLALENESRYWAFLQIVEYRDDNNNNNTVSNKYSWILDLEFETELSGPYNSIDECCTMSLATPELLNYHTIGFKVQVERVVIIHSMVVKIFKKVNTATATTNTMSDVSSASSAGAMSASVATSSSSGNECYYISILPLEDMKTENMSKDLFHSEEEARKDALKKNSFRRRLVSICQQEFQQSTSNVRQNILCILYFIIITAIYCIILFLSLSILMTILILMLILIGGCVCIFERIRPMEVLGVSSQVVAVRGRAREEGRGLGGEEVQNQEAHVRKCAVYRRTI